MHKSCAALAHQTGIPSTDVSQTLHQAHLLLNTVVTAPLLDETLAHDLACRLEAGSCVDRQTDDCVSTSVNHTRSEMVLH